MQADERKAAEAADWLEQIERENAGEMTPERIAKLEAERTPEGSDEVPAGARRGGRGAPLQARADLVPSTENRLGRGCRRSTHPATESV